MTPTERALIDEYDERGLRDRVRTIAGYDYQGQRHSAHPLWWQVHDLHMLALTNLFELRDYREMRRNP